MKPLNSIIDLDRRKPMSCARSLACLGVLLSVTLAATVARAHPAWGIVVDGHGRILFADVDHGNCESRAAPAEQYGARCAPHLGNDGS
jgi:hypothetical protein